MADIVNIVGVGNVLMGDDGVGVATVEALGRCALGKGVRLHDAGLAVSDVLGRLDPDAPLIVLDALQAGGRAGEIYRIHLDAASLHEPPDRRAGAISLHELGVAPALRLEALSGREFADVTVFGVEPGVVAWGEGLSPPVAAAVDDLVRAVIEHLQEQARAVPASVMGAASQPTGVADG